MSKKEKKLTNNEKYLFDKVIKARYEHINFYNHWMNMYAIFNGALFVGLYTVEGETEIVLRLLTVFLGVVAGWCWHFSSKGFYDWLLSYIKSTQEHEKALGLKDKEKIFYIFYGKMESGKLKKNPYSTQKLTQFFTLLVAIVWSVIAVYSILRIAAEKKEDIKNFLSNEKSVSSVLLIFFAMVTIVLLIAGVIYISKAHREHFDKDGFPIFDLEK